MADKLANQRSLCPDETVLAAQNGDGGTREYIIETFLPYIRKIVSFHHQQHRFGDEESVALMALNEAIDSYQPGKGATFKGFVRLVVERRLADYYRRQKKFNREIHFTDIRPGEQNQEYSLYSLEHEVADREFERQQLNAQRREEIEHFTRELAEYGITLNELVKVTPKHESARIRAKVVAQAITTNELWYDYVKTRKELPLKEMEGTFTFSRKTIERHRKYIIAVVLVLMADLPLLSEYLPGGVSGEQNRNCNGKR